MNKYEQYATYPNEPGWYCLGWRREEKEDQEAFGPEFGPIWYFDGSEWVDEDGEIKEFLIDPMLDCRVEIRAADYFVRQG